MKTHLFSQAYALSKGSHHCAHHCIHNKLHVGACALLAEVEFGLAHDI
jgi:hypothetical protein